MLRRTGSGTGSPVARQVNGRTDRVVVVGAGLGGLACAIRLAAAGRKVTVLERATVPGGRAGRLALDGYEFDTGPTVLTMPDLIAEVLDDGRRGTVRLARPDPARPGLPGLLPRRLDAGRHHRHRPDGRRDLPGLRPREADGYLRFVDYARELWRLERADFIDRNLDAPARPAHRQPAAAGPGRRLRPAADEDRPVLPRPAHPADLLVPGDVRGLAPHDALAIYAVIAYLDSVAGVYFPRGGIHAVPRALAGAAEKHGVTDPLRHHGDPGRGARRPGHRRAAPRTASGSRPTSSCSTPTCRSPTATCCRRRCRAPAALLALLRGPARRLGPGLRRTSPTTTSTSDGPGARPSTRSSGRAG